MVRSNTPEVWRGDVAGAAGPEPDVLSDVLEDEAYAAALASLHGVGPARLRALIADGSPTEAWRALREGGTGGEAWRVDAAREAMSLDVAAVWRAHCEAGVRVLWRGMAGYPAVLSRDHEAPAVLFCLGDTAALDAHPRVAIVGTRSATRYGLGMAAQLGADLAAVGVVVVSGLALGIDGAAHEGAVAAYRAAAREPGEPSPTSGDSTHVAPPVAIVAGSLAAPYPRQHAGLWQRVAAAGAVLSEAPLGAADLGWRFPMRNRIIAALADVVVVVECHLRGGALHTVHAAAARGIPVGAVPGSVRSPASAGTNSLLADGCFVVRDAADVLVALGLATAATVPVRVRERRDRATHAAPASTPDTGAANGVLLDERAAGVLDALGWEPVSLDELARETGGGIDEVSAALERLRCQGMVEGLGGVWRRV
ncbi:MAG: DNA-processing protein DprA [Acidimicrobiales bacterium]